MAAVRVRAGATEGSELGQYPPPLSSRGGRHLDDTLTNGEAPRRNRGADDSIPMRASAPLRQHDQVVGAQRLQGGHSDTGRFSRHGLNHIKNRV